MMRPVLATPAVTPPNPTRSVVVPALVTSVRQACSPGSVEYVPTRYELPVGLIVRCCGPLVPLISSSPPVMFPAPSAPKLPAMATGVPVVERLPCQPCNQMAYCWFSMVSLPEGAPGARGCVWLNRERVAVRLCRVVNRGCSECGLIVWRNWSRRGRSVSHASARNITERAASWLATHSAHTQQPGDTAAKPAITGIVLCHGGELNGAAPGGDRADLARDGNHNWRGRSNRDGRGVGSCVVGNGRCGQRYCVTGCRLRSRRQVLN